MKTFKSIIAIICIVILGAYGAHEVAYFADKTTNDNAVNGSVLSIPAIGLTEDINNVSIDNGVYMSDKSTNNSKVLFGHRTLNGSPFIRLGELETGDSVSIIEDGKEMHYTIKSSEVVPADYRLNPEDNNVYLITCHPIGSSEKRLIYVAEYDNTTTCGDVEEPDYIWNAIIILIGFISIGAVVSYATKDRRIMVTVIIMTVFIIMCMFVPSIGTNIPIIK